VSFLGLDNSRPLSAPRYAILYYSYSILLLTIYSATVTDALSTMLRLLGEELEAAS
jgi:hypothetical protein